MKAIRFIFCSEGGDIATSENNFFIPSQHLVVTTEVSTLNQGLHCFDFYAADFQILLNEIDGLLLHDHEQNFQPAPLYCLHISDQIIDMCLDLAKHNMIALLRFIYLYCLSCNRKYFSNLLYFLTIKEKQFYAFMEKNFLKLWPIAQFAEQFNLTPRKFNALFLHRFGMSVKTWLHTRRLKYSCELLLTTDMNILDIALECGFSNHAHYTSSFRKKFQVTPRKFREQALSQAGQDSLSPP